MLLLLIPVIAICLDTLLRAFKAQRDNPIVSGVRKVANIFIIEPFKTVFPDQSYLQNAAVALAAFGILALLIVFLFRGLRSMVGTKPPKVHSQPTPKPKPKPKPAESADSTNSSPNTPAPAETKTTSTSGATAGSGTDADSQPKSG